MHVKTLRLVTLLLWSLSNPAIAQAPPLSLPGFGDAPPPLGGIPAPPALPSVNAAPLPPATPSISIESPQDQAAIAKSIAELSPDGPQALPLNDNADASAETASTEEPTARPQKPPKEIVKIKAPALTANTKLGTTPPPLPALKPISGIKPLGSPPPLALALPTPTNNSGGGGFSAPNFANVTDGVQKSWEVPLAPSYKPKKTKFNYKRTQLPSYVYRTHYNRENQHLPVRHTPETYDQHFLHAIARNDINTTRAFLNGGRSVHMQNTQGDNTAIIALQFGAFDVARLLIERGADPFAPGAYGLSALDYARRLQAHDVLNTIWKHYGA